MSDHGHHGEWLSLLDVSGPFLAEPVLKEALPQGLQGLDPVVKKEVRQAYDEWREALDFEEKDLAKLHRAWISFILDRVLGYGADFILTGEKITAEYRHVVPENGVALIPDAVVTDGKTSGKSLLLLKSYEAHVSLDGASSLNGWAATPIERMVELCRATGVRLGLVTNGEQWALVDAPVGAVVSIASWYARLWSQEPLTLQAFAELLGIRRFFGGQDAELATLLDKSLSLQDEVTDALGEQVRRAVEVLVQSLDRADQDRNRELLKDVSPEELYEAGLTIMMRIVFLLSAEERGLLLLGDRHYEANYAVSTLRGQLRQEADEVLERRWDAWSRLLSLFRTVFAGVDHGTMRMPALGGSLFNPDRFPFLEGRLKGSNWKSDTAVPLPIDNRTVLLLLEAVQLYKGRALSYLALDVEQIGYVYEGLLERTVVRADEVTLDLKATKSAKAPWVKLSELDDTAAGGDAAVAELLKERTGSSAGRIRNDLGNAPDETESSKLLAACDGDVVLRDRIRPYFHLLRTDSWGYPLVYPKGTFMVASGSDRRETGTHYTPKSFTEAIVRTTLEPMVYIGPAEGASREEWRLRSPGELLDLKVCDPAMGSGAFLVQVCRYLADRVVEAWAEAEKSGKAISADGALNDEIGALEPLCQNADERSVTARRLIAERCLYGVDMNPLAVELAKLSIWLVTLAKGRPFGFLDHNLRCGDSLLGITTLKQLEYLHLSPGISASKTLFSANISKAINAAVDLRTAIRLRIVRDIQDVEIMERLDVEARELLEWSGIVADALIAEFFASIGSEVDTTSLSIDVGHDGKSVDALKQRTKKQLGLSSISGFSSRKPFHWPLEFPEVFIRENGGFDAILGNPPFLGGSKITGLHGTNYREHLVRWIAYGARGLADIVAYFFLRSLSLVRRDGFIGLLAVNTISQGDTRLVGLEQMLRAGAVIFAAYPDTVWPGAASVVISRIHVRNGPWLGLCQIGEQSVGRISAFLSGEDEWSPAVLRANGNLAFNGSKPYGMGFVIGKEERDAFILSDPRNAEVVLPYINGKELNAITSLEAPKCIISFWDWSEEKIKQYPGPYDHVLRSMMPERSAKKPNGTFKYSDALRERWWEFERARPALYHAIGRGASFQLHPKIWNEGMHLDRVLVKAVSGKHSAFVFLTNDIIFDQAIIVFATDQYEDLAMLSSTVHWEWAVKQGTKIKNDPRYSPSDAFETFPFPLKFGVEKDRRLAAAGEAYDLIRADAMREHATGLTKLYNQFHERDQSSSVLKEMRRLLVDIDQTMVDLYGWSDLSLEHGFHALPGLEGEAHIRFSISPRARLEILRRLNLLNRSRHESESSVDVRPPQLPGM